MNDESIVEIAKRIATRAHKGQTRKDGITPYISHPEAIVKMLIGASWPFDPNSDLVATAWLHDVLEDTNVTVDDLRKQGIPSVVIRAVELLTKSKDGDYLSYLEGITYNEIARQVKIMDITHNLSDLDREKNKHQYDKYVLALHFLRLRD